MQPIAITAIASISPLGKDSKTIWENYQNDQHFFTTKKFGEQNVFVAQLDAASQKEIEKIKNSHPNYQPLDKTVLYAIYTAREAIKQAGWKATDNFGINIGSSRGATQLFEQDHAQFLQTGKSPLLTSPTTTLGNIASWVAHDLQTQGPEVSHSITCSTALHSLLNGIAWLQSGMSNKFLVGGSEAPLTAFTIAQMQALKVYARQEQDYPNRALDLTKNQNTMILGEGASVCTLEVGETPKALAYIEGIGYATEILEHAISISTAATCFQKSMAMALKDTPLSEVDVVVMHAPGTIKGDTSEMEALQKIFPEKLPLLTTNKWKLGHTFGTSGMLSVELAVLMLQNNTFIGVPFMKQEQTKPIKKVLVNAVGFGGNAVSILLKL